MAKPAAITSVADDGPASTGGEMGNEGRAGSDTQAQASPSISDSKRINESITHSCAHSMSDRLAAERPSWRSAGEGGEREGAAVAGPRLSSRIISCPSLDVSLLSVCVRVLTEGEPSVIPSSDRSGARPLRQHGGRVASELVGGDGGDCAVQCISSHRIDRTE